MIAVEESLEQRCEGLLSCLPPFPPVAMRLMRELGVEDANIHEIVNLLRSDPALSAQLLRKANSPLYGFASRIDSLQQCLVLLGFTEARKVALTAATASYAGKAFRTPELRRCWRHAIACAEIAAEIAAAAGVNAEQAYTAGLMHDIRRLGLLVARPEEYANLIREAEVIGPVQDSAFFLDREKEQFGVDHCEAGRWLGEQWNTPVELQAAAGRHHGRPSEDEFGTVEVVHYACGLADALGFAVASNIAGRPFAQIVADLPEQVAERIGSDEGGLRERIETRVAALDGPVGGTSQPVGLRELRAAPAPEPEMELEPESSGSFAWIAVAALAAVTVVGFVLLQ